MKHQIEKAKVFYQLHEQSHPLILVNIWDAGSAKIIEQTGAKAIATGSLSVATANGYQDGENIPLNFVIDNSKRIVKSTNLPVTLDIEAGYSPSIEGIKQTVESIIRTGIVGINFEDQIINSSALYTIEEQCLRIRAIRETADKMQVPLFINARTDIFLKAKAHTHNLVDEAMRRCIAYKQAGANGFFTPGLSDKHLIQLLCQNSPLPINIMMLPDMPSAKVLSDIGVKRISYGPLPYYSAMENLKKLGFDALVLS